MKSGGSHTRDRIWKPFNYTSGMLMGVELEVEGLRFASVDKIIEGEFEHLVTENDCSLNNGVEIISHPTSLQGHYQLWPDVLKLLREHNMQGDSAERAGIHVHFETKRLGARVHEILKMHEELVKKVAGRESANHLMWGTIKTHETPPEYKGAVIAHRTTMPSHHGGFCYEFRPFRSSVEDQKFFARLELTQALAEYSHMSEPVEEFPTHMRGFENLGREMERLGV